MRQRLSGGTLIMVAARIAKPLLLIVTPIGVAGGLYEAYRLASGLVVVMIMMLVVVGTGIASVILTARRERAAQREAGKRSPGS